VLTAKANLANINAQIAAKIASLTKDEHTLAWQVKLSTSDYISKADLDTA
jgi:macrolide-specific efflux system membrane fusion protein